jgi:hypothetical protein
MRFRRKPLRSLLVIATLPVRTNHALMPLGDDTFGGEFDRRFAQSTEGP